MFALLCTISEQKPKKPLFSWHEFFRLVVSYWSYFNSYIPVKPPPSLNEWSL